MQAVTVRQRSAVADAFLHRSDARAGSSCARRLRMRQLKGRKKLRSISSESMPSQLHAEKRLPMLPMPKLQTSPRHEGTCRGFKTFLLSQH